MENSLQIKDLSISYRAAGKKIEVIQNVNMELKPNTFYGLIGKTGAGKSTLIKAVGNILPENAKIESGTIILAGKEISFHRKEYEKNLGVVLQNPFASLNPTLKIGTQFLFTYGLKKAFANKKVYEQKVAESLEMVGLDVSVLSKYPAQLSGGMNQRINLALSLLQNPKVLILDEPTSALDADLRNELMELISGIQKRILLTVLMISHDIKLVQKYADEIYVLKDGKVTKEGREFTQIQLLDSEKAPYQSEVILKCDAVEKSFHTKSVVKNLSFQLHRGECLGVVGPSGGGKSTICKILCGLYRPDHGKIEKEQGIKIEMLFQDAASSLDPSMSVKQILNESRVILKQKEYTREELGKWLNYFALPVRLLEQNVSQLSGGQRQMIAVLRIVMDAPDIVILDEPTSAMDVFLQKTLLDFLKKIQKELNLTYILVSHDQEVIKYMCHTVIEQVSGSE